MKQRRNVVVAMMVALTLVGCGKKPPVAQPTSPPPGDAAPQGAWPAAVREPMRCRLNRSHPTTCRPHDIDTLNKNSPFQPVFFAYDEDVIDAAGQQSLNHNAELMKKYSTWIVTIEGHSDERGTAEYNLALGERRALAARNYLVSLGIPAEHLRTVSYGKEFRSNRGTTRGRSKNCGVCRRAESPIYLRHE